MDSEAETVSKAAAAAAAAAAAGVAVAKEQPAGAGEAFSVQSLWSAGAAVYYAAAELLDVGPEKAPKVTPDKSQSADVSQFLPAGAAVGYTLLTSAVLMVTALSMRQWIR